MTTPIRHSNSLVVVWRVAEFEARQLKATTIDPTHLLLGLTKTVDLDLPALIPGGFPTRDAVLQECFREMRRLRTVFHDCGLNAATFRRRLRQLSTERGFGVPVANHLRRSAAARKVFANAERLSRINLGIVYPIELLFA